jgi:hypothetical protein
VTLTPSSRLRGGRAATLIPLVALAACGSDAASAADAFAVRDSAGVRIAENRAPAWSEADAWRVEPEPELSIGMVEGPAEYVFGRVAGVLGTADGGVVVADWQGLQLRWYDAVGRHLRTAGREGGGPGEFRRIDRLVRRGGDTVAVTDLASRRATFLGPDASVLGDEPMHRVEGEGMDYPIAYLRDGSTLMRMQRISTGDPPRGLVRDTVRLRRRPLAGAGHTDLVRFPGGESVYMHQEGGFSVIARAFGACGCVAPAPDGFFVGSGEAAEVVRHDLSGAPTLRIRWAAERRAVTSPDIAAYRERELAAARDRAWMEALLGEMVYPSEMPAYAELVADASGNLWVRGYDPDPAVPSRWSIFAPDGRWMGGVEFPARFRVHEIGADHVLGVWRDAEDVEYVRRHRLVKPLG